MLLCFLLFQGPSGPTGAPGPAGVRGPAVSRVLFLTSSIEGKFSLLACSGVRG